MRSLFPRAKEKISSYIDSYIHSTFSGYTSVNVREKHIHTKNVNSFYVLLPVWMVSYDYERAEHIFAMNGQTGKVVGKPPISRGKVAAWFSGIAGGTFLALKARLIDDGRRILMRGFFGKAIFVVLAVFIMMPLLGIEAARASESQQHVYDRAHLLSKAEIGKLESLSAEPGCKERH